MASPPDGRRVHQPSLRSRTYGCSDCAVTGPGPGLDRRVALETLQCRENTGARRRSLHALESASDARAPGLGYGCSSRSETEHSAESVPWLSLSLSPETVGDLLPRFPLLLPSSPHPPSPCTHLNAGPVSFPLPPSRLLQISQPLPHLFLRFFLSSPKTTVISSSVSITPLSRQEMERFTSASRLLRLRH